MFTEEHQIIFAGETLESPQIKQNSETIVNCTPERTGNAQFKRTSEESQPEFEVHKSCKKQKVADSSLDGHETTKNSLITNDNSSREQRRVHLEPGENLNDAR